MKKLVTLVISVLLTLALSTAALADAAPIPPGWQMRQFLSRPIVPVILAVLIIAIVILVKAIVKKRRQK